MTNRWIRTMVLGLLVLCICVGIGGYAYLQHPKFGKQPEGQRLARIMQSPHYVNGEFVNLEPIARATNTSNSSRALTFLQYAFAVKDQPAPPVPVPTFKTNLKSLDKNENVVIWLGHSSYFIQLGGVSFLIDPVFSASAAPVPLANPAFAGSNIYTADDMPIIDYLLISHDHWDHLDYQTLLDIKPKVQQVICGLGVGTYCEEWGFPAAIIQEKDWNDTIQVNDTLSIHVLTARHYSSRILTRNKTLWVSFALISPEQKIFFSGDGGYGTHFAKIGETFDGFDLALLDTGQYNENWRYTHMMPEDAAKAADDLRTKALLPAHVGKFSIAYHTWDDPFKRLVAASSDKSYRLLTPRIGEPVELANPQQVFSPWWEAMVPR